VEGGAGSHAGSAGTSTPSHGAGTGGTAGRGGSGSGGTASSGGSTATAGVGGTGSSGGTGFGGALGTGGQGGTSGWDAGRDLGFDAAPDLVGDRPSADAASIPGTNNPVLPGLYADPHIVAFDDSFYIYPTTDGSPNWGATSFSAFSSKNLVQWTNHGVILDVAKDLTWAKGRAWAPAIARVGDTYYFYFSAEVQLGVATSKSPTGPFKDALGAPLVKAGQYAPQSIDPYVFDDDDGARYLLFGSGGGGLRIAKLKADMLSFANTPSNISPTGAGGTLEGVGMFKRKGSYYLYWSEGDTRLATYRMAYARASAVTGPFTRSATILEQNTALGILGPGGGTILAIPSRDEHYIAYHRFKIPGGDGTNREICIDRLTFNNDGTIAPVKPTREGLQATVQP
jgi:beta-xylosidase